MQADCVELPKVRADELGPAHIGRVVDLGRRAFGVLTAVEELPDGRRWLAIRHQDSRKDTPSPRTVEVEPGTWLVLW